MRIGRFVHAGKPAFGVLEKDGSSESGGSEHVAEIEGHPFGEIHFTGERWPLESVRVLPPLLPTKIVFAEPQSKTARDTPFFLKPSSSATGHHAPVQVREEDVVYASTALAVVIGATGARRLSADQVPHSILGVTLATNITTHSDDSRFEYTLQTLGRDSFCPVGPWVDTRFEIAQQTLECRVDDEVRSSLSLAQLSAHPYEVIAELSHTVTLLPGDIVLTNAATTPVRVLPGHTLTSTGEGIEELVNPIVRVE